jgi:hypothetical protein
MFYGVMGAGCAKSAEKIVEGVLCGEGCWLCLRTLFVVARGVSSWQRRGKCQAPAKVKFQQRLFVHVMCGLYKPILYINIRKTKYVMIV